MTLHKRINRAPQQQEEKLGYYFQSGTCLGAIETYNVVSFLR